MPEPISGRGKNCGSRDCAVRDRTSPKHRKEIGVKYMQAWEERYYDREEARQKGREEGRAEGREEGRLSKLRELVEKKLAKGMTLEEIADMLEEDLETVRCIAGELQEEEK